MGVRESDVTGCSYFQFLLPFSQSYHMWIGTHAAMDSGSFGMWFFQRKGIPNIRGGVMFGKNSTAYCSCSYIGYRFWKVFEFPVFSDFIDVFRDFL